MRRRRRGGGPRRPARRTRPPRVGAIAVTGPAQEGFALALALFTLLILFASLTLLIGTWRADLQELDRERAESHFVALTDAGVDLARATLHRNPAYVGTLERDVGAGHVRVAVSAGVGAWRRLHVEASWRRSRRVTLVDLAYEPTGPVVLGWIPAALDPDR